MFYSRCQRGGHLYEELVHLLSQFGFVKSGSGSSGGALVGVRVSHNVGNWWVIFTV